MTKLKLLITALLFTLLSLFFASQCFAEWSGKEKRMYGAYLMLSTMDAVQSKHEEVELNPLFSDSRGRPDMEKILIGKAVGAVAIWGLAHKYPKHRENILWVAIGVQGVVVVWNLY